MAIVKTNALLSSGQMRIPGRGVAGQVMSTITKVTTNCPNCKKQREAFMSKTRTSQGIVVKYSCQECSKSWTVGTGGAGRNRPPGVNR